MRLVIFILTLAIFTLQTLARPLRPAREILAPKLDDRNKSPTLLGVHVVQRTAADKRKAHALAMASPREGNEEKHRVLRFNKKYFAPERAQDLLSHTGPVAPPPPPVEEATSTTVVIAPPQQTTTHAEAAAQTTMPAHRNVGKGKAKARKPKADADGKRHSNGVKTIRTGKWH
jgi:hypothetical protein